MKQSYHTIIKNFYHHCYCGFRRLYRNKLDRLEELAKKEAALQRAIQNKVNKKIKEIFSSKIKLLNERA